jgi:predicted transcriptional regulator
MGKTNKNKTRCSKNKSKWYRYRAHEIAKVVGVSTSYVKQIRAGAITPTSTKAQQIMYIDGYLSKQTEDLLAGVEQALNG